MIKRIRPRREKIKVYDFRRAEPKNLAWIDAKTVRNVVISIVPNQKEREEVAVGVVWGGACFLESEGSTKHRPPLSLCDQRS